MTRQDAFPLKDYDLPDGVDRHIDAAPQQDYTSFERYQDELDHVFYQDWVMVGRVGMIPEPGDYFTCHVGEKPVIVMRQQDGTIAAMGNFCLHRYAKLLDGSGNCRRIVCPYHHWTYTTDGRLMGTPDRKGFDRDTLKGRKLVELACDDALGFIYVSLRHDLPPVSDRLSGLDPLIEAFDMGAYQDLHVVESEAWDGNWKLVVENFIESYHTTYTHVGSIGPTNPTNLSEFGPWGDPNFAIHSNSYRPEDIPEVFNPALMEEEKRRFYVISLFPNGLAALDPNFVWWMSVEPLSPTTSRARWGLSFAPDRMAKEDAQEFVDTIREVIEIATTEDKEMVDRMQKGAAFGTDTPGVLHAPLELNVREFNTYLTRKIAEGNAL